MNEPDNLASRDREDIEITPSGVAKLSKETIEITPEMIEAGAYVVSTWGAVVDSGFLASEVYTAMVSVSPQAIRYLGASCLARLDNKALEK